MLQKIDPKNILFLDIETVSKVAEFNDLSLKEKELFTQKTAYQRKQDNIPPEEFYNRAAIWAEFGKIICISVGFFNAEQLRIKSFFGEETQILQDFNALVNTHFNKPYHLFCAHNGKEFDFPYIARRMVINGVPLPENLNLFGKKPWDVPHLDTLELWKFGDYKHYTSLNLLTHILNIPSPKNDIDGSQVHMFFYKENDLKRIVTYCERDVLAVAQVFLRFQNKSILEEENIVFLEK